MGLIGGMARTAVVAGTATAVSNRVSRRQAGRWQTQADAQAYQQEQYQQPARPDSYEGLLWFFHGGDWDWIVIGIVALLYIAVGDRLLRSSWVVLAAWGLLQVTTHFAAKWAALSAFSFFPVSLVLFPFVGFNSFEQRHDRPWLAPLSYAILGLVFIVIAQQLARRRRETIPAAELI